MAPRLKQRCNAAPRNTCSPGRDAHHSGSDGAFSVDSLGAVYPIAVPSMPSDHVANATRRGVVPIALTVQPTGSDPESYCHQCAGPWTTRINTRAEPTRSSARWKAPPGSPSGGRGPEDETGSRLKRGPMIQTRALDTYLPGLWKPAGQLSPFNGS